MGARYVPCMHNTTFIKKPVGVTCPKGTHLDQSTAPVQQSSSDPSVAWPCPNTTTNDAHCSLSQLCGFNENKTQPRQWFRFITPIFMHAGIVHIGFNLLLQLTLGKEMEQEIGPLRFALVYLSSGIFGFVLGGNFAPTGIASTGASGALFGIIALMLLDLLYYWDERKSPWVDLMWILLEIGISFVLGLLPGLDNFSHIGGFIMGLVLGICILHSPNVLRKRIGLDEAPYAPVTSAAKYNNSGAGGIQGFAKQPVSFFKGRKPLWWAWWLVRVAALIGVLAGFILLLRNFYNAHPTSCSWCKHLSCLVSTSWSSHFKLSTNPLCRTLVIGVILDTFSLLRIAPAIRPRKGTCLGSAAHPWTCWISCDKTKGFLSCKCIATVLPWEAWLRWCTESRKRVAVLHRVYSGIHYNHLSMQLLWRIASMLWLLLNHGSKSADWEARSCLQATSIRSAT